MSRLAFPAALLLAASLAVAQEPAAPAGASGAGQNCVGGTGDLGDASDKGKPAFMRADVRAIGEQITCYCGCPHLQVSKCFCGTADKIREDLAARLDKGDTPEAVIAAYVAEHGASILAVPPRRGFHWIIWVGPPLLLILGAVIVWLAGSRWAGRPTAPDLAPEPLDPEVEAKYKAAVRRAVEEP